MVDHKATLAISGARWHQIKHASADDPMLQELRSVFQRGWPDSKKELPLPLYDVRDELTIQDEFVFKGQQIVAPASLRKELIEVTHASHIGIEACIRRARESLWWPRMSAELKQYVECDICLAHRTSQTKEPLMQHQFLARPWSRVAVDLCELNGRTLLVASDYYNSYIEVSRLTTVTSKAVIKALKEIFARFDIPDEVVSDSGPQFSSAEFAVYAKTWSFDHVTSSPTHVHSNGKAENAVKTVKRLFTKCQESGHSEYLALLDWRNTPSQGIGTSPAQRLMGRRCKTLLPIAGTLLMPRHNTEEETRALVGAKERQRFYYNRNAKPLPLITPGETIRMRLPGEKRWTKGTCAQELGNRSYQVKVGSGKYRRNRRDLLKTNERPLVDSP